MCRVRLFFTTKNSGEEVVNDASPARIESMCDEPYAYAVYLESIPGTLPKTKPLPIIVTHHEAAYFYKEMVCSREVSPGPGAPQKTFRLGPLRRLAEDKIVSSSDHPFSGWSTDLSHANPDWKPCVLKRGATVIPCPLDGLKCYLKLFD